MSFVIALRSLVWLRMWVGNTTTAKFRQPCLSAANWVFPCSQRFQQFFLALWVSVLGLIFWGALESVPRMEITDRTPWGLTFDEQALFFRLFLQVLIASSSLLQTACGVRLEHPPTN